MPQKGPWEHGKLLQRSGTQEQRPALPALCRAHGPWGEPREDRRPLFLQAILPTGMIMDLSRVQGAFQPFRS